MDLIYFFLNRLRLFRLAQGMLVVASFVFYGYEDYRLCILLADRRWSSGMRWKIGWRFIGMPWIDFWDMIMWQSTIFRRKRIL